MRRYVPPYARTWWRPECLDEAVEYTPHAQRIREHLAQMLEGIELSAALVAACQLPEELVLQWVAVEVETVEGQAGEAAEEAHERAYHRGDEDAQGDAVGLHVCVAIRYTLEDGQTGTAEPCGDGWEAYPE